MAEKPWSFIVLDVILSLWFLGGVVIVIIGMLIWIEVLSRRVNRLITDMEQLSSSANSLGRSFEDFVVALDGIQEGMKKVEQVIRDTSPGVKARTIEPYSGLRLIEKDEP